MGEPSFSVGIEEEYFLVGRQTRDVVSAPTTDLIAECQELLGEGQVSPELLRSQIEVQTCVCSDMAQARAELARARAGVAEVTARHGLAAIAASTHPFASWDQQIPTDKARYTAIARDLQAPGRRLVICGMHVHVAVEDDELRMDLMNQAAYFLPHLLALSTSSPFWRGQDTGMKSYRVSIFREIPRTGLPETFESWGEYARRVRQLVGAGLIEDPTKLWWDVRPSHRFPTLEMRVTDICTRLDHAIAVAALWRCLLRMLWRLRRDNLRWRLYPRMLIEENRWRAQRYGIDEGLVDFGKERVVPYSELLDELIALVAEDSRHFGCEAEVASARHILTHGTSAHEQLQVFTQARSEGASEHEALVAVVDRLMERTVEGL
ncbi:MAG: carboxylate-amine ligase [Rhodospirillaceae bacterium]|nr:carboxylate-amine ligase [Rhodospirillales bacterium]